MVIWYLHVCAKSLQLCSTLCNLTGCSPPGSSVIKILQARIVEWITISFFRGSSKPRDRTHTSYVSCISRKSFYHWYHLGSHTCKTIIFHSTLSMYTAFHCVKPIAWATSLIYAILCAGNSFITILWMQRLKVIKVHLPGLPSCQIMNLKSKMGAESSHNELMFSKLCIPTWNEVVRNFIIMIQRSCDQLLDILLTSW